MKLYHDRFKFGIDTPWWHTMHRLTLLTKYLGASIELGYTEHLAVGLEITWQEWWCGLTIELPLIEIQLWREDKWNAGINHQDDGGAKSVDSHTGPPAGVA